MAPLTHENMAIYSVSNFTAHKPFMRQRNHNYCFSWTYFRAKLSPDLFNFLSTEQLMDCLLYTSDAADE